MFELGEALEGLGLHRRRVSYDGGLARTMDLHVSAIENGDEFVQPADGGRVVHGPSVGMRW